MAKSITPEEAYALLVAKRIGTSKTRVLNIFRLALHEASLIASQVDFDDEKPFAFDSYPLTKGRSDKLIRDLSSKILSEVQASVSYAWGLSEKKYDELEKSVKGKASSFHQERALQAFLDRRDRGLGLSDRVWRVTEQAKQEIEMALDLGLRKGQDAASLARTLQESLNEPSLLFRRVRDEHGELHLSSRAKAYHPGRGVYRSSYKNALRLTATETNIAYRTADYLRVQELDFVRGIRVNLSKNHTLNGTPFHCICDEFAGDYPKDFKFTGWHPLCRCYTTTILSEDPDVPESTPEVTNIPQGLNDWVANNPDRIDRAFKGGNPAYFLKDNAGALSGVPLKYAVAETARKSKEVGDEVQGLVERIARKHGASCSPINFKSEESTLRKVMDERVKRPRFRPDQLKDAVRSTIVAKKEDIASIIKDLEKENGFYRWKEQNTIMGYQGNIINIRMSNGMIAEIQVVTPQMIYGKEKPDIAKAIIGQEKWERIAQKTKLEGGLGHKFYEEWRVLPEASPEAEKIARQSRAYYRHILTNG